MTNVLEPYGAGNGQRLIVAGGGTGGHLFPGVAVAQAFLARHSHNKVMFINSGRPLDTNVLNRLGWPYKTIPIEGIKHRGAWKQLRALFKIPRAISCSAAILREFAPHVVLGVGGYSAGPVVVAAWLKGIPTALHEQNQLPGLTNRLLRRIVKRVYLTFKDTGRRFNPHKTVITGNPVRDEIIALGDQQPAIKEKRRFDLLLLGGSQGAHAINQAMMEALPLLKDQTELHVVHQTGTEDEADVAKAYAEAGISAQVKAFFNEVAELYLQADLIICRAGATTVAEITAVGRAAVFVPFPHAADDHQTSNAQALVTTGAAEMIAQKDLNGEILAKTILAYMQDRTRLADMAGKAMTLGRPEAALTIVDDLYQLIGR
ncbi:MAG: undecaprenyldiphospho-muramoylpentapeptide beta-N-acetylglucosaminyltransferase [Desulfobacteraceae bacterium]|nr:undecaprenyldiphospho-muramoylpentapeptide beta-N-acetylglucosaminyltransferase [Desulfobacteraceae bacterium]